MTITDITQAPPMEQLVTVVPQSHRERCLYWARIFALPRAGIVRDKDGTLRRVLYPASEPSKLAAEALRFYAEHGAYGQSAPSHRIASEDVALVHPRMREP